MAGTDVVLNATYMRHNVPVTDAAIAAGVHLVDLGSYYPETLQQLERHEAAVAAGCRIVPGCGVAPGPDQHPRPARRRSARRGRRDPDVLVHHPPDVDVAGHRRHAVRCEHRDVGRPRGRRDRRATLVHRRGGVRLPGAVRPAGGPSRAASRAGDPAAVHRGPRRELQGGLPGRRDDADPRPARTRVRPARAVHLRWDDDLAGPLRRRLHRPARHRPGRPQRQRQARPGRGPARRARR